MNEKDRKPSGIQEALISLFTGNQEEAFKVLEENSSDQPSAFCLIYLKEKMGDSAAIVLEQQYFAKYGSFEESKKNFHDVVTFIELILKNLQTEGDNESNVSA